MEEVHRTGGADPRAGRFAVAGGIMPFILKYSTIWP
jgi:hypothetical protein